MRVMKVKKRIFKREFLGFRLTVVVADTCEVQKDIDGETTIEVNKVFWVFPSTSDIDFENIVKGVIPDDNR